MSAVRSPVTTGSGTEESSIVGRSSMPSVNAPASSVMCCRRAGGSFGSSGTRARPAAITASIRVMTSTVQSLSTAIGRIVSSRAVPAILRATA